MSKNLSKVGVIGAGRVGNAVANGLVMMGVCMSVVLYNRTMSKAEGEAWDIEDAIPLLDECDVQPSDKYEDLADCDVIVVTIGAQAKEGQDRLDLLGDNADIMRETMKELDQVAPNAVVIIISNPVDVLTRIAIDTSTRPENLIIGSGTVLDTARAKYQLGKLLDVSKQEINIYVIGEHGESAFFLWSSALIGTIPVDKFPFDSGTFAQIKADYPKMIHERSYAIGERKGGTSYGISTVACQLVDSILRDEKKIFTVSVRADSHYKVGAEVVLSLPCVIGKQGIARKLLAPLNDEEQSLLDKSATQLIKAYDSIL